jgi:hypothetical protein
MAEPTLRWLMKKNEATAEEVRAYADREGLGLMQAKVRLENRTQPILQQNIGGTWVDVPFVVVPHG